MQQTPENSSSDASGGVAKPVAAKRWSLPRLPVLIGVIGLGAMVTVAPLAKRRMDARQQIEAQAVREEMREFEAEAIAYRSRLASLQWNATKLHDLVTTAEEPLKSWARERARRFAAFVGEIEGSQSNEERAFKNDLAEIEALCASGEIEAARERLARLQPPKFPAATELMRMQEAHYLRPLAQFSRQNPGYYRALQTFEPEASAADVDALRRELTALEAEPVTPQTMLGFELFAAVAPTNDPLVQDWATLSTAADFFEAPDAATVALWRQAQKAVRADDWPTAVARMQAILRTKVRTRQPFRAAYARSILRNRPDDTAAAYGFMQEAATAGDAAARAWISEEDFAKGRLGAALPWLEARVSDGEREAIGPLLKIYATAAEAVPRDATRELGMLQRIVVGPDAPVEAWLLLARLYESGRVERSPEKALACFQRAAERGEVTAAVETAERRLRGKGAPVDLEAARDWAAKAFAAGERERSVPLLIELMRRTPDRTAAVLQPILEYERENVAAAAGFADVRIGGNGLRQLQMMIAQHLDRQGRFAQAGRFYEEVAQSGERSVAQRLTELTTSQACAVCGGKGNVHTSVACVTCGGKGTVLCGVCDGRGFNLRVGPPPCTTCGGSGGLVQDGRAVACGACEGSGKGKGSVTKEPCSGCVSGRAACRACENGRIKVTKTCAACRGKGERALVDE